ncbi:hypothetical protein FRC19_011907 [Serendipita sp. 401]|nr:hypothetical protein FRC19_011907 [Serendipita sp. 401]
MPPTLTTPELASPSPSLSSAVDSLSTQSRSISSSSSASSLSSTTTASTFLPRTIAISLGIFGALVILAGFAIVVRSRIRARTEILRQNLIQDNHNRIYNAGPTTTTTTKTKTLHPPRLAAAAATTAAAEPRRLKALSFLQGREGPKEWIPGGAGAGAGAESGVKRKRSERSTKSIRKSFLTFSSSLTRKSSAPSGQKSTTTTTTAAREATAGAGAAFTLKPYGGGRGVNDSQSTEYLNPAAVDANASVASSPSTASPRFLEYQTPLPDFTMPQRSNPTIATTVRLQRSQPDGLTVAAAAAATNNRNVCPQVDVLLPIPAQTMPTSTPPMHVRVQMSRVEVLSEPRVPLQRITPTSASISTSTALPTIPPPIRPAPAPQLGVNRTLAVASPPPLSSRPLERGVRDRVVTPPGTRTERLPSVASTDEPSLISYYYDGPRDLVFGGKDERPLSTTSFKSPRRI